MLVRTPAGRAGQQREVVDSAANVLEPAGSGRAAGSESSDDGVLTGSYNGLGGPSPRASGPGENALESGHFPCQWGPGVAE